MFNIDRETWTLCYSSEPVTAAGTYNFSTEAALTNIADVQKWSREDLEKCWNEFAGVTPFDDCKPAKRIKNRPTAIRMIWNAIQRLAPEAEQKPTLEAQLKQKPKAEKKSKQPKQKPKVKAKAAPKPSKKEAASPKPKRRGRPRAAGGGKKDQALALMKRLGGVTSAELKEKFGWNDNSITMLVQWIKLIVRAEIRAVEIDKNKAGEWVYKAA